MQIQLRRALGVLTSSFAIILLFLVAMPAWAAEKVRLRVDDYQIVNCRRDADQRFPERVALRTHHHRRAWISVRAR